MKLRDHVKDREAERAREGMPPPQFSTQMQFLTVFLDHIDTKALKVTRTSSKIS